MIMYLLIMDFPKEICGLTLKSEDFKGFIWILVNPWIAPKNCDKSEDSNNPRPDYHKGSK